MSACFPGPGPPLTAPAARLDARASPRRVRGPWRPARSPRSRPRATPVASSRPTSSSSDEAGRRSRTSRARRASRAACDGWPTASRRSRSARGSRDVALRRDRAHRARAADDVAARGCPLPHRTSGDRIHRAALDHHRARPTALVGAALPRGPTWSRCSAPASARSADSRVTFQGLFDRLDAPVISWSDSQIVCRVPAPGLLGTPQVLTGPIKVWTATGGWSDGDQFSAGRAFNVLCQWAGDSWPAAHLPIDVWVNPGTRPLATRSGRSRPTRRRSGTCPARTRASTTAGSPPRSAATTTSRTRPAMSATRSSGATRGRTSRDSRHHVVGHRHDLTLERLEVDMEVNGSRPWTLDPEDNPNSFDLPSTLCHEFGHWLRLGHTQSRGLGHGRVHRRPATADGKSRWAMRSAPRGSTRRTASSPHPTRWPAARRSRSRSPRSIARAPGAQVCRRAASSCARSRCRSRSHPWRRCGAGPAERAAGPARSAGRGHRRRSRSLPTQTTDADGHTTATFASLPDGH